VVSLNKDTLHNIFKHREKKKKKKKKEKKKEKKILKLQGIQSYFRITAEEKEMPSGGSIYSGLTEPSLFHTYTPT